MFRVGDQVEDVARGEGVVVSVDYSDAFPVLVAFSLGSPAAYLADGRREVHHKRSSLYKGRVKVLMDRRASSFTEAPCTERKETVS